MRVWAREREITSEPWWCATNDAMAGATAAAAEGGLEEGDDGVRLKRKGGEAWREWEAEKAAGAEEMSVVWWVIEWLPKSVRATNALWSLPPHSRSSFSPLLPVAVRLPPTPTTEVSFAGRNFFITANEFITPYV